jgi:TonB family protein
MIIESLFLLALQSAPSAPVKIYRPCSSKVKTDCQPLCSTAPEPCLKPPEVKSMREPEYTEEARREHYEGTVVLYVAIDENGKISNLRVARSLGLGLDEQAIDAVKHWKFKPAQYDGKPVPMAMNIEISFHL